jgi:hypothetical protein
MTLERFYKLYFFRTSEFAKYVDVWDCRPRPSPLDSGLSTAPYLPTSIFCGNAASAIRNQSLAAQQPAASNVNN